MTVPIGFLLFPACKRMLKRRCGPQAAFPWFLSIKSILRRTFRRMLFKYQGGC